MTVWDASKVVECQLMLIGLHAVDSLLGRGFANKMIHGLVLAMIIAGHITCGQEEILVA